MFIPSSVLRFKYLVSFVAILESVPFLEGACETGWFGSNCQYKCHCTNDSCDRYGECTMGRVCVSGWFGPACQYQDLLTIPGTRLTPNDDLVKDRDDETCLKSVVLNFTISFNNTYPITWIRFNVHHPDSLSRITLTSPDNRDVTQRCSKRSPVDERTIDVLCGDDVTASELVVGVASLCSLYISGGRNVALKQAATQSSTYSITGHISLSKASNSVDGKTSSEFIQSSCTHTDVNDTAPNLNITFSTAKIVNRYVIYNRNSFLERLFGGHVYSFNASGHIVFNYTVPNEIQPVVSVWSPAQQVVLVNVRKQTREKFLTLCEIEIYGDSLCQSKTYGLDCNKPCNCQNQSEKCFVATGGCLSGCAAGSYGDGCQSSCPSRRWGVNCLNQCNMQCSNQSCHPSNGTCVYGCVAGFKGVNCADGCSSDDRFGAGIGVGAAISCVVGLVMVVISFCIFKRRQQHSKSDYHDNTSVDVDKHPQGLPTTNYDALTAYESKEYEKPVELNITKAKSSNDVTELEQSQYCEIADVSKCSA